MYNCSTLPRLKDLPVFSGNPEVRKNLVCSKRDVNIIDFSCQFTIDLCVSCGKINLVTKISLLWSIENCLFLLSGCKCVCVCDYLCI